MRRPSARRVGRWGRPLLGGGEHSPAARSQGVQPPLEGCAGDGNCLYRALSRLVSGSAAGHRSYRQCVVSELRANPALYRERVTDGDDRVLAPPLAHGDKTGGTCTAGSGSYVEQLAG